MTTQSQPPSENDRWGLASLRLEWERRRIAVLAARARIDPTGMTRPQRDPVERAWLEKHQRTGPFLEVGIRRVG
jgi:hypothetical protein